MLVLHLIRGFYVNDTYRQVFDENLMLIVIPLMPLCAPLAPAKVGCAKGRPAKIITYNNVETVVFGNMQPHCATAKRGMVI